MYVIANEGKKITKKKKFLALKHLFMIALDPCHLGYLRPFSKIRMLALAVGHQNISTVPCRWPQSSSQNFKISSQLPTTPCLETPIIPRHQCFL